MDCAEVQLIDRAMQALGQDYRKQRRLEDLYSLPSSRKDCRTVATNQWRLLTLIPHLGLQVSPRTSPVLATTCNISVSGAGVRGLGCMSRVRKGVGGMELQELAAA